MRAESELSGTLLGFGPGRVGVLGFSLGEALGAKGEAARRVERAAELVPGFGGDGEELGALGGILGGGAGSFAGRGLADGEAEALGQPLSLIGGATGGIA